MRQLTELCRLAIKHSTDKGGRHKTYNHQPCHGTHEYTPIYFDLFHRQRHLVKNVLEIGVNKGCSLRMWRDFFPNAMITGLDIDNSCLIQEERIQCFQADQNDPRSLVMALEAGAFPTSKVSFDVIIDDGSHLMTHQVISMVTLLPALTDIGVYVIEDIPVDLNWADYLLKHVPAGFTAGVVYPPLGTGEMWPEQMFIVTRENTP